MKVQLSQIAYARSGDKGSGANVGVIAYTAAGYELLRASLTAEAAQEFFQRLGATNVKRYELPNLLALNFILQNVLDGGASLSLRIDPQGKALGQALLEMELDVPQAQLSQMREPS